MSVRVAGDPLLLGLVIVAGLGMVIAGSAPLPALASSHSPRPLGGSESGSADSQGVSPRAAARASAPVLGPRLELRPSVSFSFTSIFVGAGASGEAYDSAKGEVFVVNVCSFNVSVISDSTDRIVASIPLESGAGCELATGAAAYDSGWGEVFVAVGYSTNVTVINDTTDRVVAEVPVGNSPSGLTYAPDSGEVFVANQASDNVSVINDSTDKAITSIPVGDQPLGVAYDTGRGEVFVSNSLSASISVLSATSNTLVTTVPLAKSSSPDGLVDDRGQGDLLVAEEAANVVAILNDTTYEVVANISTGSDPETVAYDGPMAESFVGDSTSGEVSVINDSSHQDVANISGVGPPGGLTFDSGKGEIFSAGGEYVTLIPTSLTVAAAANVTSGPAWLDVNFTAAALFGSWAYPRWSWTFGDGSTGTLQNATHVYEDPGSYLAFVEVTDSDGAQATSAAISITVGAPLPFLARVITTAAAVDVGEPETFASQTRGGAAPFTDRWSLPPPADGCSLATSYLVTCVPTQANVTFNVSVEVTDAYGATVNLTSANVSVGPALVVSLSISNSAPTLGQPIALVINASGGVGFYSYAFLGLPPGCVVTGEPTIGCLPTQAGNYTIIGSTTDSNGWTVSASVNLSVIFDFTVVAPSQTALGTPMTLQVQVAGEDGTLTYSYTGLPPGCASQDVANLTCTPTQVGTYSVLVVVHDEDGHQNQHTVVVRVTPPLGFLGLPGNEGYYVVAGLAGVLGAVVLAAVLVIRRRNRTR